MWPGRGLAENTEFRSTFDMNFKGFTQTIPKKSYFQKKAEEAHKIFEGLGPKVELVSCGIFVFLFCFAFYVASCSNSAVVNSCSSVVMYKEM